MSLAHQHDEARFADARRSRNHDPTGTAGLRRRWRSAAEMRLRQLRAQLRIAVVDNDILGLAGEGAMQYQPALDRLRALQQWFERMALGTLGGPWPDPHVDAAWRSGHAAAAKEVGQAALFDQRDAEYLSHLAQAEFAGIAAALTQHVVRASVAAAAKKMRPVRAYALMVRPFDKMAIHRLRTNCNLVAVKAHNDAKLASYREAGVTRVGIAPESAERRLTFKATAARDAFDPSEPRDLHGEWTGGGNSADFTVSKPEDFIAARNQSTRLGFLSPTMPEDLVQHKLLTGSDGKVGVAIDAQGDLQNLFNNGGPKGACAKLVVEAINNGARTLDCYDGFLPNFYRQFGFRETGRMVFNPEYAHGWDMQKYGPRDVVFMAWKGYDEGGVPGAVVAASRENWITNEKSASYATDFDAAKAESRAQSRGIGDSAGPGAQRRASVDATGDRPGFGSSESHRRTLGPDTFDAWNPDQPREPAGSPEGGEWAGGGAPKELKIAELTKVGKQMGSNSGGVYADASGKKFYVKQGKSADHVRNEMLAVKLYQLAGTPLLRYRAVEGGKHIATEIEKLDKKNANALSPQERAEAAKDFAVHAWLANWDAVGLGGDNIGTIDGQPVPLDLGGALAYRAQGAPKGKAFGDTAGEIDTLRDPGVNPDSAHMFGGMTPAQLRESASFVTKITDQEIRDAVKESGSSDALADRLIKRRDDITQRAKTFGTEGDPTKSSSTVIFAAGDQLPMKALNGIKFKPWSLPEGTSWNDVDGQADLGEAELSEHQLNHKKLASGIVIREPDGRIWLVRPKGAFGGYQHTFPKGRVEAALSLQANAIKEAWEETGIKVRITGLVGDREGDLTLTRYYLAERESGEPHPDGKESDGVALVPPNRLGAFLNRKRDKELAASIAGGMAQDAYDPNEPRDPHGEWTSGADLAAAAATAAGHEVYWHGSASGDLRGGTSGLHLGTKKAATQALEARIGIPADGKGWTGDREYGETLLAGSKSIKSGRFGEYRETGFNAGFKGSELPTNDFYPKAYLAEHPDQHPTYPDKSLMPMSVRPSIEPYLITGEMTNSPRSPHTDVKANAMMRGQITRGGTAKRGYFYKNEGEDGGSISAVVPSGGGHLQSLNVHDALTTLFDRPMSKGPGSQTSREEIPSPSTIYRIEKAQKALEEEVGEEVDVLTAGDELVCEACQDIADGGPYTLDEAEGLIPSHGNCRCSFRPADDLRFAHDAAPPARAAGVMFVDPDGHMLFTKRIDTGEWAIPAGGIEEGEDPRHAAQREAAEETGYPGDHRAERIDRRITNGVDFHTFLQPVARKFEPILNEEHSAFTWASPHAPPVPLHPGLQATLKAALTMDYSPDQPRVPSGSPEGGQWGSSEDSKIARSWAERGSAAGLTSMLRPDQSETIVYHGLKPGHAAEGFMFVTRSKEGAAFHGDVTAYRIKPGAEIHADLEAGMNLTGQETLLGAPASESSGIVHRDDLEPASSAMNVTEQVGSKAVDPEMLKSWSAAVVGGIHPDYTAYAKAMETHCKEIAAAMYIDPDLVSVSNETKAIMGGVVAGSTNNNTGKVTMFAQHCPPESFAGVLTHELEHVIYAQYRKAFKAEQVQVDAMTDDEVRAAYTEGKFGLYREFAEIYDIPELRKEDGVSTYSAQWWAKYDASGGKQWASSAVHETLAEMARKKLETGELPGGLRFQALYMAVRNFWHERKPQGYHA